MARKKVAELEQSAGSEIAVGASRAITGQKRTAREMESTDMPKKKPPTSNGGVKKAKMTPSPEAQGQQLIRNFLDQFAALPLVRICLC